MNAKGKPRSSGAQLARYVMTGKDGELVQVVEVCGGEEFGKDPVAAFDRMEQWAAEHTKCRTPFFHGHIRLAPGERLTDAQWMESLDRMEKRLGFEGQPRIVSFHIDQASGEKHLHAAWFRVDMENEEAIDPGLYKKKLVQLSRTLEREFALRELTNERPRDQARTAERDEYEECKRLGVDPQAVRNTILNCLGHSDSGKSFKAALEEQGLMLANGDRRDCFVVINQESGHHPLNKRLTGMTLAALRERLADLDRSQLPSVEQAKEIQRQRQVERSIEPPEAAPAPEPVVAKPEPAQEFPPAANRTTEPTAPVFDREADEVAWQKAITDHAAKEARAQTSAAAGMEKHGAGQEAVQGPPKPERELSGTAADIRMAWSMTRTVSELEDALASHGISLARASAEEAKESQRTAAFAKAVGNFAIAFEEHEIVAVDGRGQVYRLDERTTGQSLSDIAGRLASLDRDSLLSVADTKEVMDEAARAAWRDARRAEREEARPASGIETAIAEALMKTMTGTEFAASLDEKGLTIARVTAADVTALEAVRQDEQLAQAVAAANREARPYQRQFAEVLTGDFAAVTRQGDVYRLSPEKLDLEDIEQRLADVQSRMPSVIEARAQAEIMREETAKLREVRQAENSHAHAMHTTLYDEERTHRTQDHEVAQKGSDLADTTEAVLDQGERAASRGLANFAKSVERILGGVFSFFFGEPKLTPLQQELQARANEELAEVRAFQRAAQEKETGLDWLLAEQRRQRQEEEREAEARERLDRGRERERDHP